MGFISLVGRCLSFVTPMGFFSLVGRWMSFVWNNPTETKVCCESVENRICALPDDLLVQILRLVPTKDAAATMILSKRWRYVWTMLPALVFIDKQGSESIGSFIGNTLQLHKARKLELLIIRLMGPRPVDVGKWIENAVNLSVEVLDFNLLWETEPMRFPKSLYTCDTLVDLTLYNKIIVDVSFRACLPSLLSLSLLNVVYKDEESLVRLLSSSPVLNSLTVHRHEDDNLKNFTVRVSSLQTLDYSWCKTNDLGVDIDIDNNDIDIDDIDIDDDDDDVDVDGSTLVMDTPALTDLTLASLREDYCLIEDNMPCLSVASLCAVENLDDKFLRCLSSITRLQFILTKSMEDVCSNKAIKFSRLIKFYFSPADYLVDNWLEPFMFFLQNSPKLQTLIIDTGGKSIPISWNQPSFIHECLSSHLETFVWRKYGGREGEKQLAKYIMANSKCLKTIQISLKATCNNNLEELQKELESMPRISTSSRLLFPTQIKLSDMERLEA